MDNEMLLNNIKYYIEADKCNYAIVLDGDWGTGKTHYFKNNIKNLIEEKQLKILYISLFGLNTVEEIKYQIFSELMPISEGVKNITKSKFGGLPSRLKSIINLTKDVTVDGITSYFNISISDKYMHSYINSELDNKYFLVFDDFERTNIDTIEILGFINEFIEHKNIKTLIISNQKEVRSYKKYENIELKYLVALDKGIKNYNIVQSSKNKNLTFDDLNQEVESIFKNDKLYKEINEKVIGKVLEYRPNLELIISNIYSESKGEHKDSLNKQEAIEYVLQVFKDDEHNNIRTFKLILEYYDNYIKCVTDLNLNISKEHKIQFFKCISKCLVVFKKTGDIQIDKDGFIIIKSDDNLTNALKKRTNYDIRIFNSVVEFIKTNNFDKVTVEKECNEYSKVIENDIEHTDYWGIKSLVEYWEAKTDEELSDMIDMIYKITTESDFSFYSALIAIRYLYDFKYLVGFDVSYLEELELRVKKHINSSMEKRDELSNSFYSYALYNSYCEEFLQKREELSDLIKARNNEIINLSIMDKYTYENYGTSFNKDLKMILYDEYLADSKVIDIIDLEKFKEFILKGDNDNLVRFKQGVYKMFFEFGLADNSDFYYAVIDLFEKVLEVCDEKVKSFLLKDFIKELNEKRERLR